MNGGEIQIGVGFGNCGILHVGGVFKRVEYCLIGEGLSDALRSLKLASNEQPVIISSALSILIKPFFKLDHVINIGIKTDEES